MACRLARREEKRWERDTVRMMMSRGFPLHVRKTKTRRDDDACLYYNQTMNEKGKREITQPFSCCCCCCCCRLRWLVDMKQQKKKKNEAKIKLLVSLRGFVCVCMACPTPSLLPHLPLQCHPHPPSPPPLLTLCLAKRCAHFRQGTERETT